jgi:hypothetical protein
LTAVVVEDDAVPELEPGEVEGDASAWGAGEVVGGHFVEFHEGDAEGFEGGESRAGSYEGASSSMGVLPEVMCTRESPSFARFSRMEVVRGSMETLLKVGKLSSDIY